MMGLWGHGLKNNLVDYSIGKRQKLDLINVRKEFFLSISLLN